MKFLVVDDHELIREALRSVLLELAPDATVLQADTAAAALSVLRSQEVDLVLLDLNLPDGNGLDLLSSITAQHPATAVVMLSAERDQDVIRKALDRGAQGFIPKAETRKVLTSALSLVLSGGVYVPPVALNASSTATTPATSKATLQDLGLTDRQLEVLALLMQGKNNKLICRALNLAEPTVKNHVSAILRALDVNSRTEAVLAVTRLGWQLPSVD